jgi:hypothetical protein
MEHDGRDLRRTKLALVLAAALAWLPVVHGAETYTFDAAQFEKKPVELGGYLELKYDHFDLNKESTFYRLRYATPPQRANLDRGTATLKLTGKARAGDWLLTARTHSERAHDQLDSTTTHRFDEFVTSWKPVDGFTLDAGKMVMKWGKGYAWNPVGFVERPKDPTDPELAREGFTVLAADFVKSFEGPFKTVAFTPLVLPVTSEMNHEYGAQGHINVAAKLYLLYRDTDIDFYYLNRGSRSPRFGMDFSRNLSSNLEIHGEWARIDEQNFALTDELGNTRQRTEAVSSWLIGLRHLSERDTTTIVEYYRNGTGFSEDEFRSFLALADRALQAGARGALFQRAQSLVPSYARQTPLRDYLYLRVSQKEPLDILYFTPAVTAIVSVGDGSYSISPELLYTGWRNIELRARVGFLGGGRETDFGERQNKRRIEIYARLYF